MSFVRAANPIWYMVDLTGVGLDDRYYAFFLTNDLPYIPQPVYQDPNGILLWNNPIEFGPDGCLPNNLYFDPNLVYRIEIRKGSNQNDPLIRLIENFVPGEGGGSSSSNTFSNSQNLITNPQFIDIDFVSPLTYTQVSPGTYTIDVGPGWQLVLTGAGTTVLTQIEIAGSTWNPDVTGNPPFALTINNSGWTSAKLEQTFINNGEIFSNGAVSMAVTAIATGSAQNISLSYVPSGPSNSTTVVLNQSIPTGTYTIAAGAIDLPESLNSDEGLDATVKMVITLPGTGILTVTNVQFIGQSVPLNVSPMPSLQVPKFQEISYERSVDQEFHVYKNSLLKEPKNSILTGWNFGNNPWQFTSTTPANVATNAYTADQTIVIQQKYVASGTGNNVSVGQDSADNNYGFKVTAVTANNQFAILQYIDPNTIRQYWGSTLSSMVKAFITTSHSTSIGIKMRLIWKAGLPGTLAQADPISSWTAGGDPVAAAGYTLISPINDPAYILTSTSDYYSFNGFVLPDSSDANMTLGILLYTNGDMDQTATADFITINDVSLVNNDFALPTQPETFDETLKKCQFYYEKSYDHGTLPGATTSSSELVFHQAGATAGGMTQFFPVPFSINFKNTKCSAVLTNNSGNSVLIYSPATGTVGNLNAVANANNYQAGSQADYAITNYAGSGSAIGLNTAVFIPNNNPAASTATAASTAVPQVGFAILHYTVNACLGNPTLP